MKPLPMKDDEIAASYRQAKDPENQVVVLSELNDTTPENIRRILIERCVYVPPKGESALKKERKRRPWTEEELRTVDRMRAEGKTWEEISANLRRTMDAVTGKYYLWEKRGGEKMQTEKKQEQSEQKPHETAAESIVKCGEGGLDHLEKMLHIRRVLTEKGMDVQVRSIEADGRGGMMFASMDGMLMYLEVPE